MRPSVVVFLILVVSLPVTGGGSTYVVPLWPERALDEGIEGWVEIEYWVTAQCVLEMQVSNSEPPELFNSTAKEAVDRWLQSEGDLIDWSKVEGVERPTGELIAAEEFEEIDDKIERAGPWPKIRTIRNHAGDARVECLFSPEGILESADVFGPDGYQESRASDSSGDDLPLLNRESIMIEFELLDR